MTQDERQIFEHEIWEQCRNAGIFDDHGTFMWNFIPGEVEVSSSGGTPVSRLGNLLKQVQYLVDDLARQARVTKIVSRRD